MNELFACLEAGVLRELSVKNEDVSPILGSICLGSVVNSIMGCLSTLLISQIKIFF